MIRSSFKTTGLLTRWLKPKPFLFTNFVLLEPVYNPRQSFNSHINLAEINKLKNERMAMKNYAAIVSLMGFVLVSNMAESASRSASAPAVDCSSLALSMADCLSFVTSGSTVQKPEGSCCSGLKTTLKTDAECLCEGFKNSAQLGITLNVSKALTLPAACHVSAPSVSDCGLNINLNGGPAASPTASSPSSNTATPPTSSGTTEVATPPPPGSSGSSVPAAISSGWVVLGLLVVYLYPLF